MSATTTVLLARHGESDWNVEGRWQGHADRPLSDRGREQAHALAERLVGKRLQAIYTSDLRRARDTAEIVGERLGLPVQVVPALREVDVGEWSGLTRAEAQERFPGGFERWERGGAGWEHGETYERMSERVLAAIRQIGAAHAGGCALVVTHGGPIRAVHSAALGLDVHTYRRMRPVEPNARISAVCVQGDRVSELTGGRDIENLLARGASEREPSASRPPTPAG